MSANAAKAASYHKLVLIAAAVVVVAAFMPWVRVAFVTVSGIDGDGQITAIAAGVTAIAMIVSLPHGKKPAAVIALLSMGVATSVGVYHLTLNDYAGVAQRQVGVYLTTLAGGVGVIASILLLRALGRLSASTLPASSNSPSAGWFPDPYGRWPLRWWDGAQWTAHVSQPGGTSSTDAVA